MIQTKCLINYRSTCQLLSYLGSFISAHKHKLLMTYSQENNKINIIMIMINDGIMFSKITIEIIYYTLYNVENA